jgi:hypothetical protein
MGIVVRHTDLSWQIPGPRADVDLPLDAMRWSFLWETDPPAPPAPDDEPPAGSPGPACA